MTGANGMVVSGLTSRWSPPRGRAPGVRSATALKPQAKNPLTATFSGAQTSMTTTPHDSSAIRRYHAHVYFNASSLSQARELCEAAAQRFDLAMGHVHEKPVGPHPDWSCQLAFAAELFGTVVPWLALNRAGLVVLVHPETGDDLADHRDHAIWLGASRPLDLRMFELSSSP